MKHTGLKIFLSYHKPTPCYCSDIFQPIQVGSDLSESLLDNTIHDNNGCNISNLNPYYCELTGHYWVLKNYINNTEDEYIGFAHYRRLPDILNISDDDYPSIYGINYSQSLDLFNNINNEFNIEKMRGYDIILPCSCYMYKETVNPQLRNTEPTLTLAEHYQQNHDIKLLNTMREIISQYYPEYVNAFDKCLTSKKSHFFNIYIMKTKILSEFLEWEFDILDKLGKYIAGWNNPKYYRMAGFLGEIFVNILINHNKNYSLGYLPLYMIDFESEYVEKINEYHTKKMYDLELLELNKLLQITSDKFSVLLEILNTSLTISDNPLAKSTIDSLKDIITTSEEYYQTGYILSKYIDYDIETTCEFYIKSLTTDAPQKLYAQSFLHYAQKLHNISKISKAWEYLNQFTLTEDEKNNYNKFKKIQEMV